MSTSDHIFMATGLPLQEVAQQLADAVGGRVSTDDDGSLYVVRDLASRGGQAGGELAANEYVTPSDPAPHEVTVLDGYDTDWNIRIAPTDEDLLHEASQALFAAIETLPWPALLVRQLDLLIAARRPGEGVVQFPEGTTPDGDHQHLWAPFAVDRPASR